MFDWQRGEDRALHSVDPPDLKWGDGTLYYCFLSFFAFFLVLYFFYVKLLQIYLFNKEDEQLDRLCTIVAFSVENYGGVVFQLISMSVKLIRLIQWV